MDRIEALTETNYRVITLKENPLGAKMGHSLLITRFMKWEHLYTKFS